MAAPGSIAYSWGLTLVEPLVSTSYRTHMDQLMRRTCAEHPAWAAAFYGGVIADLVRTLPDEDPWRHLSGRLPDCTVGTPPADATFGAWRPDGTPFGTVEDATDLLPSITPDPALDPGLVALALQLPPTSAALIAFGEQGWAACQQACLSIADMPVDIVESHIPESQSERICQHLRVVPGGESEAVFGRRIEGLWEAATCAVRWACHRRRTQLGIAATEDTWVTESFHRWAWRADRIAAGRPWPMRQVERAITEARIISGPDLGF